MKQAYSVLSAFLWLPLITTAQTGPGGCGTSANNVLWLNGNKGISLSGTTVTQWSDQSGNNNHAIPNAATNQPTYVTGIANGNASLDFDGTDDELRVAHHASISLTQWHIFLVVRPDVQKNYNAWFVKGDDGSENYELLSYNDGNIHMPVWWTSSTRTFPNGPAGLVNTTTFEIIEYTYSSPVGRDLWKNHSAAPVYTDNESTTPSNNTLPLYIGNERSTAGRFVNGNIAEAIMYNAAINSAQKIIVNNYLSAKYNRTLGVTDIYVQDDAGNGNYDYDVLGIGRVDASNMQTDSRGSGIVRILNASNLNDNEFFICGHNNGVLGTWGSTDIPSGIQGRWFRSWRVSEVNASGAAVDVGSIDIRFDLTGLGPVTVSQLRLLVDTDNDGIFADETPISGATSLGGNIYQFAGVSAIANNMRFTLATTNIAQTPLPVELLSFDAGYSGKDKVVYLKWVTATEINNDYFTVERSADGENWTKILERDAAGNSNVMIEYPDVDPTPLQGQSYYRLKQTDFDGNFSYSQIVSINIPLSKTPSFTVYPNPSNGNSMRIDLHHFDDNVNIYLTDMLGQQVCVMQHQVEKDDVTVELNTGKNLSKGVYVVTVESGNDKIKKRILVE